MIREILKKFTKNNMPPNKSIEKLLESAKNGDPESQYELSIKYLEGDELEKDEGAFERWALTAYENGNAPALYKLAHYHRNSEGKMRIDLEEKETISHKELAYQEFEILAESGLLEAQEILGEMYRFGEGFGIEENKEKSIYWYTKAAVNGSEQAQEIAGYMKENEI